LSVRLPTLGPPPSGGWRGRLRAWRDDRFLRRVAVLSSGTIAGQLVLVLATPLLTRLYTPAEFGAFAVFSALTAILGTVMCLRYEQAVPLVAAADVAPMIGVSILAALVLSALLAGLVAAFGPALAALVGAPELAALLWLVAVVMLLWGLTLPLAFASIRRGAFRANALNKTLQLGSQAAGQLGLGLVGGGLAGLVVGYSVGYVVRLGHFLAILEPAEWRRLAAVRLRRLGQLARAHRAYPLLATPAALLQASTQMLPTMLVALLYGPAMAGWFGLAQRILELPVRLLGMTTSQVFLTEIARSDPGAVYRLFVTTARRFLVLGLLGMAPLLLLGPWLFALIFGEEWRTAGILVQCLVPAQLARFVVMPVSQVLNVLQRQDLHLFAAGLNLLAMAASFAAGWWLGLGAIPVVLLFSLGSALAWLVYFLLARRIARARAQAPAAPTGPAPVPPAEVD
jgi:O-antigen/teichoic acid export membrane protein